MLGTLLSLGGIFRILEDFLGIKVWAKRLSLQAAGVFNKSWSNNFKLPNSTYSDLFNNSFVCEIARE
jgi:hypothetical protein